MNLASTSSFIEHLGMRLAEQASGSSRTTLQVQPQHFNSHGVVHGAVVFALADTGMGAALYPSLDGDESCATVEIKINYFRPVLGGEIVCTSTLVHRGRTLANLDSNVYVDSVLVAKANGSFSIFKRRAQAAG